MKNIDVWFIRAGLIYVLAGMVFGIWLGINQQFQFAATHAHINLVGFVMMVLYGLVHRAWPSLRASRIAAPQFWLHLFGALVFITGIYIVAVEPQAVTAVIIGALLVLTATLLFAVMFFANVDA